MNAFSGILFAGLAIGLAGAPLASAQPAPSLVNKLEVQKLVAENTPEANGALAGHFAALAARYEADAARHTAMASAYPSTRGVRNDALAVHCRELAMLAADAATAAREMADYHRRLAGGEAPPAPKDASALDAGRGAPEPTKEELQRLAATAGTARDHRQLEEYYMTLASRYSADAETHTAMARTYRAVSGKTVSGAVVDCERIATFARKAAREATDAAALHRQLANVA